MDVEDRSTTLDVKTGGGEGEPSPVEPVKVLPTGNPLRVYLVGVSDYCFDLGLVLYWFLANPSFDAKAVPKCKVGTSDMDRIGIFAGLGEALWIVLFLVIMVKEAMALWVAFFVLRQPYRSNLIIQAATSFIGCGAETMSICFMATPSAGNPMEDDPDNPTVLEDINVTVAFPLPLRKSWMALCLLENAISLLFGVLMAATGGCLMKDPVGMLVIICCLLTTLLAIATRLMRVTSETATQLPGIRRTTSLFGAVEHGELECYDNCAVLTSDLSGFTKTTKEYGIVFMASVIQRMRQMSLPVAYAENPHSVGFEADDLIIVFRDVETAFRAAAIINYLVIKNREDAPEDEVHFTPKLGGLGIHCGPKILKHRNGSQLYGATAAEAYHLGEEMAEKELILSEAVYKALTPAVQKLFNEKVYSEEDLKEHEGSKPIGPVYARKFTEPAADMLKALDPDWKEGIETLKGTSYGVKFADTKDMSRLPPQMDLIMQIQWPENRKKEKWDAISDQIKQKYEVMKVALLCDIQFSNDSSPSEQVTLEGERERIVNAAIIPNKGISQDDKLTMFDETSDATLAVIALRRGLAEWNRKQTEDKFKMACCGFGIHKSDCLVIPGTDVHWGYAVNAASKIGEDCGEGGEILLTDSCYDEVKEMSEFKDVFWIRKELEASGNHFIAYQLNERTGPYANTEPGEAKNPGEETVNPVAL